MRLTNLLVAVRFNSMSFGEIRVASVVSEKEVVLPYDRRLIVPESMLPAALGLGAKEVKAMDDECKHELGRFVAAWTARATSVWRTCDGDLVAAAMIRAVAELANLVLRRKSS